MHIVIIHDKRRTDRYDILVNELKSQNIDLSSVVWQDAIVEALAVSGISKAHCSVIAMAQKNNWPSVTVFEDDIKFVCKHSFKTYSDELAKHADFDIFMTGPSSGHSQRSRIVSNSALTGFHCYTVASRFYETFLQAPSKRNIDVWATSRARVRILWPYIAIQHDCFSDNQKRNLIISKMYTKKDLNCAS